MKVILKRYSSSQPDLPQGIEYLTELWIKWIGEWSMGIDLSICHISPQQDTNLFSWKEDQFSSEQEFLFIDPARGFQSLDLGLFLENARDMIRDEGPSAVHALALSRSINSRILIDLDEGYGISQVYPLGLTDERRIDGYTLSGLSYFPRKVESNNFTEGCPVIRGTKNAGYRKDYPYLFHEGVNTYGLPMGGRFFEEINSPANFSIAEKGIYEKRRETIFLDRDGVMIKDTGYFAGLNFQILPGILPMIRAANSENKLVIVVTNQSGVARGYYTEEDVIGTNRAIEKELLKSDARIDAWYYCPYHPDGIIMSYSYASLCRKPEPGMLLRASSDLPVDLGRSKIIGDRITDRVKLPYVGFVLAGSKLS